MYLEDVMTVPASLAGLPAVSVPVGTTADELPVGLQVIGARKDDAKILAIANDAMETVRG
jgi:aspartyl-tRNA(Asn)/glutamyl-tRNA(Gln) amidotransferase subunit A